MGGCVVLVCKLLLLNSKKNIIINLAKSEAALLLAVKQAAFIRNPDYRYEGSGPEIVTIGHNPYVPNLGLAYNIPIKHSRNARRRKFIDEFIYERLFLESAPNAGSILSTLKNASSNNSLASRRAKLVFLLL